MLKLRLLTLAREEVTSALSSRLFGAHTPFEAVSS
jgi:hypothetical protein